MRLRAFCIVTLLIITAAIHPAVAQVIPDPEHFQFTLSDQNHSLLVFEALLNNQSLAEGDEIGLFNPRGTCSGASVVFDNEGDLFPVGMAAMGDASGNLGFRAGEQISFRYWQRETNREFAAEAEYLEGERAYTINGFTTLNLSANPEGPPEIQLSNSTHDFADVLVNQAGTWQLTISNVGVDPLTVSSIASSNEVFTTNFADGGVELAMNEHANVTVTFSPVEEGHFEGTLTINSNDPANGEVEVLLTGNGTVQRIPDISIDPEAFNFGQVEVQLSDTRDLTISNPGTGDLTVSNISINGAGFSTNFGGAVAIAPGDSRVYRVTFSPAAIRQYQATLTITSNDPDEQSVNVSLAGEGYIPSRPDITVSPEGIQFGEVVAGDATSRTLTIGNAGDQPLTISAISSDNEVFYTNFDQGDENGPHFQVEISDANHSILITDATINGTQLEAQDEIGVFTPAGVCGGAVVIEVNEGDLFPAGLAAWGDNTGQHGFRNGEAMSFKFWDNSSKREINADATIEEGRVNWETNGFTVLSLSNHQQGAPQQAFEQTIEPGSHIDVTVFFAPSEIAHYDGALTISSNDPRTPEVSVNLSGDGVPLPPDIELPAMAHDFGGVLVNRASTWQFNLNNVGVRALTGEMWVEGDEYSVTVGQFNVQGGSSVAVRVIFAPTDAGQRNGVLHITSNDPDEGDLTVQLTGLGQQPSPNIALPEMDHDFGQLFLGDDRTWAMTIRNDGELRLDVNDINISGRGFSSSFQGAFSLNSGASTSITVHFRPEEERQYNEALVISSNDPDSPELRVNLAGRGAVDRAPDIRLVADVYNFHAHTIGEETTLGVRGENEGDAILRISSANVSGDGFVADFHEEIVVNPGSGFSIPVTFSPQVVGEYRESLTITSDDPDEGQLLVTLLGVCIPNGDHFAFNITADNMSVIVDEAFLNEEQLDAVDEIAVFTESGICAGATVIGNEWPVGVAVWGDDPNEAGQQGFRDGEVISWRIWDRFRGREYFAQAEYTEGEGIYHTNAFAVVRLSSRTVPAGHLRVAPLSLDFGRVLINNAAQRVLTLTNIGDGNLRIEGITAEAPYSVNQANAFSIQQGRAVQIQVNFAPRAVGNFAADVTIHSNDPDQASTIVEVTGVCIDVSPPQLVLSNGAIDFNGVPLGAIASRQLIVSNEGGSVLHVDALSIQGQGFSATPNGGFSLEIGESRNIQINFAPSEQREYNGSISLTSDDPDNHVTTVSLRGIGVVPEFYWYYVITDNNMSLLIDDVTLNGEQLPVSTEVGVFTPTGINAGVTRISEYPCGLAAWGDDANTRDIVEGFRDGEALSFRVWNPETEQELTATPTFTEGAGRYSANGFAVLTLECEQGRAEHFGYTITDVNHSLLVLDAYLNGEPLSVNDEAAVFTPGGICAGSTKLEEDGTVPFGIAAWADDAGTGNVDGYRAGEQLLFRFWDASARRETTADPIWDEGPRTFTPNGFSVLHLDFYSLAQPQIEVESAHNFGNIPIGSEATWDMIIRNGGEADLVVSGISAVHDPFSHGAVDAYTLASGESRSFTVTFAPQNIGDYADNLVIRSNDRIDREVTVSLTGSAYQPNEPPVWVTAPARLSVDEGGQLLVTYRASDPNDDHLQITLNRGDLPEGPILRDNGDGTGTFSWTPGFNTAGVYNFSVVVSDSEFHVSTDVNLTVTDVNRPPVWADFPEAWDGYEGEDIEFTVRGQDLDGDAFTLGFDFNAAGDAPEVAPEFIDNNNGSALFRWTPSFNDDGDYTAIFHLLSDHPARPDVVIEVPISIANVNRPPMVVGDVAESIDNYSIDEDAGRTNIVDLDEAFVDLDGDALTFSVDGIGQLNLLIAEDHVLSLQPDANYHGVSEVAVIASDGHGQAMAAFRSNVGNLTAVSGQAAPVRGVRSLAMTTPLGGNSQAGGSISPMPTRDDEGGFTFNLNVVSINDNPVWVNAPRERFDINEGDLVQFDVSAADADGDQLRISLERANLPQDASFTDNGNGSASFEWQTGFFSSGDYHPDIVISDGTTTLRATVRIVVTNINREPEWDQIPQQVRVNEGEQIQFDVRAFDRDNERLTITLGQGLPQAAGLVDHQDGTATFTWQTAFDQAGNYEAVLNLSDGHANVVGRIPITIGNLNREPEVLNAIADKNILEDANVTVVADLDEIFRDRDGDRLRFTIDGDQRFGLAIDGNNVLTTHPAANWSGTGDVTITAADDVSSVRDVFSLTVEAENDDPSFVNPTREAGVNEGGRIQFTLHADDADLGFEGDDLSISLLNEAGVVALGASFRDNNDNTASFDWQTDNADGGVYHPIFRVEDHVGAHQDLEVVLTITNVNRAPGITQPSDQDAIQVNANENEELTIRFVAGDADNQQLAWRVRDQGNLPQGWNFTDHRDGSATFVWTPGFDARRQAYTPVFEASDPDGGSDAIQASISVANNNRAPTFVEPTDQDRYRVEVNEGQQLSFPVRATDADGDNLQYRYIENGLPEGATFRDNGNGSYQFIWTPGFDAAQDEPYFPEFTVVDGEDQDTFLGEITVRNVNRNPVIDQPADSATVHVSVNENAQLVVNLHAGDADGGALTWSVSDDGGVPQGWQFNDAGNGSAQYTWTPDFNASRENPYIPVFRVVDNGQLQDQIRVEIRVVNINRDPVAAGQIQDVVVDEDPGRVQVADLRQVFTDPDGDALTFSVTGAPAGLGMQVEQNSILAFTPVANFNLAAGAVVNAVATDPSNRTVTVQFRVTVRPINDAPGAFDLAAPANGTVLVDYRTTFRWTRSVDPDGDQVRYQFAFTFIDAPIDTVFRTGLLNDTLQALNGLDTLVAQYGLGDSLRVRWWVTATDGQLAVESSSRRVVIIPPLAAPYEDALPLELSLSQNYPNPFNPETKIEFALPKASSVRLAVVDNRGRQIALLANGELTAGRHSATWKADTAPAGIYFFILQTGSERRIVKGTLLK